MRTLYTTGYLKDGAGQKLPRRAKIGKTQTFDAMVQRLNLLVIDIRLVPWSEGPMWRKDGPSGLSTRLCGRYLSVPSLGNRNYNNGAPVQLADPCHGCGIVLEALAATDRTPLLLCGCEDVSCCHRADVARLFACHYDKWVEIDYWCHPADLGLPGTVIGTTQPWEPAPAEPDGLNLTQNHTTGVPLTQEGTGA